MKNTAIGVSILCGALGVGIAQPSASAPSDQPIELGKVAWVRDFDQGVELAAQSEKPIMLLFQEVPG